VPIGAVVAKALGLPLDIVLSKKIGHPYNQEFAIGSVSLDGVFLDENAKLVSTEYIKKESQRIVNGLQQKYKLLMGNKEPLNIKGKTVLLVDDGIATGNTVIASLETIKKKGPSKTVVVSPVAPPDTVRKLEKYADEVICLLIPGGFHSTSEFYEDFSEVSDNEVKILLGT
jgi:predicted phosphoribosyltransferase